MNGQKNYYSKQIEPQLVMIALVSGWNFQDAIKGYGIVSDPTIANGASYIKKIDVMNVFEEEKDAIEQAKLDGIHIIEGLPKELQQYGFIENKKNIKLIQDYLKTIDIEWNIKER